MFGTEAMLSVASRRVEFQVLSKHRSLATAGPLHVSLPREVPVSHVFVQP
jgi:hypothetical protein